MHIGEFAAGTGVPPRLLRYYEDQGLLEPARDDRGWRVYDAADRDRVTEIRGLLEAGLPTAAIAQLLGAAGETPAQRVHVSDELHAELRALRDRIDARIHCLIRNRDALDGWLHTTIPHDHDP